MKKIVVFNGSPRPGGYSVKLLDKVIEGAQSKGAQVIVCNLNDDGVKGCQGCNWCMTHTECLTKDKMSPALEELRTADGLVSAFPVYFGDISGQSKLFFDRLYSFLNLNGPKHPGKKFVSVYTQGNNDPDKYKFIAEKYNDFYKMFGWEEIDTIFSVGGSSGAVLTQEILDRAFEAGCRLAE